MIKSRGRPRIYHWDDLLVQRLAIDQPLTLVRGVDYHCSDVTMAQQLRNQASARELAIKVFIEQGRVVICRR